MRTAKQRFEECSGVLCNPEARRNKRSVLVFEIYFARWNSALPSFFRVRLSLLHTTEWVHMLTEQLEQLELSRARIHR